MNTGSLKRKLLYLWLFALLGATFILTAHEKIYYLRNGINFPYNNIAFGSIGFIFFITLIAVSAVNRKNRVENTASLSYIFWMAFFSSMFFSALRRKTDSIMRFATDIDRAVSDIARLHLYAFIALSIFCILRDHIYKKMRKPQNNTDN